ncbi:MAG: alkaline phosphatase family protein [Chloroflexi bacterium]|nr:alkaline phosphatase family protein [Chloroflexota bacterium]
MLALAACGVQPASAPARVTPPLTAVAPALTGGADQPSRALADDPGHVPVAAALTGIHKIQHVVILMQENHSFDNYFGTFPGADGIPMGGDGTPSVCVPDPATKQCVKPFHDPTVVLDGGPHTNDAAVHDIDGGKMDGFIAQQSIAKQSACQAGSGITCKAGLPDVMGYHDAREIPNYWTYAEQFVLQDHMFSAAPSYTLPTHMFMVSGWSAKCDTADPMSCKSNVVAPAQGFDSSAHPYAWTDITYLLHQAGVSWGYYVGDGSVGECDGDALFCPKSQQGASWNSYVNPMPGFATVAQDDQEQNVQPTTAFYDQIGNGTLPAVSWVMPDAVHSEHPPYSIQDGEAYVTDIVDRIMKSPEWDSTAIFVTWDEWGGFYDHVTPPTVDQVGYGIRVPGLIISAYAKQGYIDHQTATTASYLKFIEDDFLSGQRLDPTTDGRPDSRPSVRENAPGLGDLQGDFDFNQPPRPPVILNPNPAPGPASCPATPLSVPKTADTAAGAADALPAVPAPAPVAKAAAGTCTAK